MIDMWKAQIQPSRGDVHVNRPLTNISIAYMQAAENFVADRVFPPIPVNNQSDRYYVYDRGDFNRDGMKARAPSTESAGGGFKLSSGLYACGVYGFHKDVDDQIRANQDSPISMDRDATNYISMQGMIRRERQWATEHLVDAIWTFSVDGAAARSTSFNPREAANNQVVFWNDADSTPIEDVRILTEYVQSETAFRPNILVLARPVWNRLVDHPDIVGRIDRGQTTGPAIANREAVAALFELDEVLVMESIYNSADEGQTASHTFIGGKNGLLAYRAPAPGLLVPSAGYTFNWRGLIGGGDMGMRIKRFRMEELSSDRVEIDMAFDQKVIGADLGVFLDDIIQ